MVGNMPTVVFKGSIFLKFDAYLEDPANRWEMLKLLRSKEPTTENSVEYIGDLSVGGDKLIDGNSSTAGSEKNHTLIDWFGQGGGSRSSFFRALSLPDLNDDGKVDPNGYAVVESVSDIEVQFAQKLMERAMREALEVSLGLEDDQNPPANAAGTSRIANDAQLIPAHLRRNVPVCIYWICGKARGFDVQVAWTERQVDFFIVTPPIKWLVEAVEPYPDPDDRRKRAKRWDGKGTANNHVNRNGMILVRRDSAGNARKALMKRKDGGVSEN